MDTLTARRAPSSAARSAESPLRIEMVVPTLTAAGMEQVVAYLVRWLAARGHDAGVTCIEELGAIGERLRDEGYRVSLVPTPGLRTQWWPKPLAAWLRRLQPDVVHPHSGVWLKAARAAHQARCPTLVATIHGIEVKEPWYAGPYTRLACRYTSHVVAVSENVRDYFIDVYDVPEERIRVILNGIDPAVFHPGPRTLDLRGQLGISPDSFVVGHVARLAEIKNQAMLVRAMGRLREHVPQAVLVIAGDGPLRVELTEMAGREGLGDAIRFLGERRDICDLYREFDAFALSSWIEATSMSILEAMASGVPVVATAVGGNPSLVGDRGLLVPSNDHDAMATGLCRLAKEPALRSRIAQMARTWVLSHATVDVMAARYESLYRRCLEAVPRRGV